MPQYNQQHKPQLYTAMQPNFPPYSAQYPVDPSAFRHLPPEPLRRDEPILLDASYVTPTVSSLAIERFLSVELLRQGFQSAEPPALHRLELEVTACKQSAKNLDTDEDEDVETGLAVVEQLFGRAKEYVELANRSNPSAVDVVSACDEFGMSMPDLMKVKRSGRKRKGTSVTSPTLVPPSPPSPPPDTLPSDEEGAPLVIPVTLRSLPSHLPHLPPKHTYLRTTLPTPTRQAIPSLEKKLQNAALVQESLRNLLQATEDDTNQEDGELFGGTVNWQMTRYPRKRWKVKG